jgi:hypothetical protein
MERAMKSYRAKLNEVADKVTHLDASVTKLREEMATKTDLAKLREENRKEHLELFVSIRTELRQELTSHMGAIEETLSTQLQLILEAQQQFVRRDELAELLS